MLKNLNGDNFIKLCDKLPSEILHVKVCKLILGVHRKTTNHAVRGDLGSYPLLIFMISLSIKYWWNLNNLCMHNCNSYKLVIDALVDNRKLCNNSNIFTWSLGIKKVLSVINREDIWDKPSVCSSSSILKTITSGLEQLYNTQWKFVTSNSQPKLRTYCCFKDQFCTENYTVMFNRSYRLAFTKLRISSHSLRIESGRHTFPKTVIEDRICNHCDLNKVEDEYHFVMECTNTILNV